MVEYGQEAFDKALKNGVREFDNITLNNLKFNNIELEGLIFTNCNLNEVRIIKSVLIDISFENCVLKECNFSESELDYIMINETSLEKTDFSRCLINSSEQYCWNETTFTQCNFEMLQIYSSLEIGYCIFQQCNLNNAIIQCHEFLKCKILNTTMKNLKVNSGITRCEFKDTDLENSRLEEIEGDNNFSSVNLKKAVLIGSENIIKNLFEECNMEECELGGLHPNDTVNLENVNLFKANLEYISWTNANLKGCNLEEANLIEAELQNANLERANLKNANLKDANLENATLKDVNLEGANLEGTRLKDANLDRIMILEKDYEYVKDYVDRNKIIIK